MGDQPTTDPLAKASDKELVRQIRAGSLAAGNTLLSRHWAKAWRAAYAVLGERASTDDATQSAVERAFRNLDRFDDDRPFGPWFARIAVNQALNVIRARRSDVSLEEHHASDDPYAEVVNRDEVFDAVSRLSPDRRLVVVLRYWADLDPPEIARALGVPVGTVSSRLSRALADLRATLEEVTFP